jgi:hypothetical protein
MSLDVILNPVDRMGGGKSGKSGKVWQSLARLEGSKA